MKSIDNQAIIGILLMFFMVIYASIRSASSSQVGRLGMTSRAGTGGATEGTTLLEESGGESDINLMEEGNRQQVSLAIQVREQGWCSVNSAHLPPLFAAFDLLIQHHAASYMSNLLFLSFL